MRAERDRLLRVLTGFSTGALVVPDAAGGIRSWPVTLARCDGIARAWLFAPHDTALAKRLARCPRACLALHGIHASASIVGTASLVSDRRLAAALWVPAVERAYVGHDCDDTLLLRVDPVRVEVWDEDRSTTVKHAIAAVRSALGAPRSSAPKHVDAELGG